MFQVHTDLSARGEHGFALSSCDRPMFSAKTGAQRKVLLPLWRRPMRWFTFTSPRQYGSASLVARSHSIGRCDAVLTKFIF